MSSSTTSRAPLEPQCEDLLREIEAKFQSSDISPEKWYLAALSAFTTSSVPHMVDQVYLYLINQPAYSSGDSRKTLIRKIREALFKSIALVGLPKAAEALISIINVEAEDGIDHTFSREGWKCDEQNYNHGITWLKRLYAHNTAGLFHLFERHRDFGFWVTNIAYGLHFSDRQNLDDLDTELVVLPAVMGQNLPRQTHWHIRGLRRLGISQRDVEMVCECVHRVARFCGSELDRVPDVTSVEDDLK